MKIPYSSPCSSPDPIRNDDSGYLSDGLLHTFSEAPPAHTKSQQPATLRRKNVKRRLFDLDPVDLNENQLSPGKRSKVDEKFIIELEVQRLVAMQQNLKKAKLRGKLRSPGSPKDSCSFKPIRPKIELIDKRLHTTFKHLYEAKQHGELLELCCAIFPMLCNIPRKWDDESHAEIASRPLKTTSAFIHIVVRENIAALSWTRSQISLQIKRLESLKPAAELEETFKILHNHLLH